jgi:hypothetical protein
MRKVSYSVRSASIESMEVAICRPGVQRSADWIRTDVSSCRQVKSLVDRSRAECCQLRGLANFGP